MIFLRSAFFMKKKSFFISLYFVDNNKKKHKKYTTNSNLNILDLIQLYNSKLNFHKNEDDPVWNNFLMIQHPRKSRCLQIFK